MSISEQAKLTIGYMQDIAVALEDVGTMDGTEPINPTALENLAANIKRMPLTGGETDKYTLENQCGINIPSGYESKVAINKISGRTIKEGTSFVHHPIDKIDSYFLNIENQNVSNEIMKKVFESFDDWNNIYKQEKGKDLFIEDGEWYVITDGAELHDISMAEPCEFATELGTYTFYFEECARGTATYYVLATNTVNTNSKGVINLQAGVHKFGTCNECNSFYFTYGGSCTPDLGMEGASFKFKNFKIIPGTLEEENVDFVDFSAIRNHCADYGVGIDEDTCNYIYWEKGKWYYKQMCESMPFSEFVQKYTSNSSLTQSENSCNKKSQYFIYTCKSSMPYKAIINNYFDSMIVNKNESATSFTTSSTPMMCLRERDNACFIYIRPSDIDTYFNDKPPGSTKLPYAHGTAKASVEIFEDEMAKLEIIGTLTNPITEDITEFMDGAGKMLFISTNKNGLQAQAIVGKNTRNGDKVAAGFLNAKFIRERP